MNRQTLRLYDVCINVVKSRYMSVLNLLNRFIGTVFIVALSFYYNPTNVKKKLFASRQQRGTQDYRAAIRYSMNLTGGV